MKITEEMLSRFLAWPLPKSVLPDACVMNRDYPYRVGTHLLTADEARQMLGHVLQNTTCNLPTHRQTVAGKLNRAAAYLRTLIPRDQQTKKHLETVIADICLAEDVLEELIQILAQQEIDMTRIKQDLDFYKNGRDKALADLKTEQDARAADKAAADAQIAALQAQLPDAEDTAALDVADAERAAAGQ